jgi:hypothetical protein
MTSFPVHTVEEIITAFGLKDIKITPINGEPTLQSLIKAHNRVAITPVYLFCERVFRGCF